MEESMEELEARLYSQVYHDTKIEETPEAVDNLPPNLNLQSNKRYWQKSKNLSTQNVDHYAMKPTFTPTPNTTQPKIPMTPKPHAVLLDKETLIASSAVKTFVPYTSVLSFMASPMPPSRPDEPAVTSYEKKKSKPSKFPKAGQLINPLHKQSVTKSKSAMKIEIQAKKQKATMARKKAQNKTIMTIELDDSDESDCIPVELPPPPLITLDSSDEEILKKKRALSPSTSSIVSDDFIVAGDKRRLVNPFASEDLNGSAEKLRRVSRQKETLEKVKALTKVPSSSSSDSARSSIERNAVVTKPAAAATAVETRSKRKSKNRGSWDNSKEDSIYGAKTKTTNKASPQDSDSSDNTSTCCVNAKNQMPRRRKSTASQRKSTDGEQESDVDEDPKTKLIASTPVQPRNKRSRFITPNYNDDEFATMISGVVQAGGLMDDETVESNDATKTVTEPTSVVSIVDSVIVSPSIAEVLNASKDDCEIIEIPIVVYEVPDDEPEHDSDSDNSLRGCKLPVDCDLSLNVTQTPYDPHEYIRSGGETSSQALVALPPEESVNPEVGWNDEMKFFYDGSWGDEGFSISHILESMPRDPKLWRINNADRFRTLTSGSRVRCKKCNEIGHIAARCKKPRKQIVCFMCGEEGHRETRCPNSICLRCGKPNKLFATVCSSCHKMAKKYCPLCNYQGHDIEQCPDKWRRYHSTTTDAAELNNNYKLNPRVYCSICARRGHFAENCNQFTKTISGLITSSSINIKSHKPSYPRIYLNSFDAADKPESQLLALFTFVPNYRFCFNFSRNVQLYPKFLQQFMLHKQRQEIAAQTPVTPAIKMSKKQRAQEKKLKRLAKRSAEKTGTLQVSCSPEGNRTVTSTQVATSTSEVHDDSNSNYSFSEFYQPQKPSSSESQIFKSPNNVADNLFGKSLQAAFGNENVVSEDPKQELQETHKLVKNPFAKNLAPLGDFIPLNNDENRPQTVALPQAVTEIQREIETVSEATIMLRKDHFMLLNTEKGKHFLTEIMSRFNIVSQFKWDNTGNSLMITGFPADQSMFHVEVREFLFRSELDRSQKSLETSMAIPKSKIKLVNYLRTNLQSLRPKRSAKKVAKQMVEHLSQAEQRKDCKNALKWRKSLNVILIGYGELRQGGEHIGALRKILVTLEKEIKREDLDVNANLRKEIVWHMKPIFSSMNHGDYRELYREFLNHMQQRKKQNLLPNPIINHLGD